MSYPSFQIVETPNGYDCIIMAEGMVFRLTSDYPNKPTFVDRIEAEMWEKRINGCLVEWIERKAL